MLQADKLVCEHGHPEPCGKTPDHFYIIFPLALGEFGTLQWSSINVETRIELLRGPLQGLETLHAAGYMHRDITNRNILVMSWHPAQAVLCDYGKAIKSTRERISTLGPIHTLAPEVDGQTDYTNKIDIWGLGFIYCAILLPEHHRKVVSGKPPSKNLAWYVGLKPLLLDYGTPGSLERSLGNLVLRMINWNSNARPSAAEALKHPCMELRSVKSKSSRKADQQPRFPGMDAWPPRGQYHLRS